MTESKPPAAPSGLGKAGRALWRSLTGRYVFDHAGELAVLEASCRQLDVIVGLEAAVAVDGLTVTGSTGQSRVHPAVAEARQGRLAFSKLLADLRIPADDPAVSERRTSAAAKRAAEARWKPARQRRAG